MDGFIQDIRYGIRTLTRSPGFTVAAVITLALGIGANGAIFSLVNGVLLRPLEYLEAQRLVAIFSAEDREPSSRNPSSPANFLDWRRESESFEHMTSAHPWAPTLTGGNHPERLQGLRATPELFDLLGAKPSIGSVFHGGDEGQSEPGNVVVLGHALWQRQFGGDPEVVGSSLVLDGESFVVLGVMAEGFQFPPFWATGAELWAPLAFTPETAALRGASYLRVFARMRSGVSLAEARAEMDALSGRLELRYPDTNSDLRANVEPLLEPVVASVRSGYLIILVAAALVLLIACANIASLQLVRGLGRWQEISLRAALGANRSRLLRQLLTESLLLSLAGCVGGALLAIWGLEFLLHIGGSEIPRVEEIRFDGAAFAFTLGASLLTGLLFGLLPAMRGSAGRFAAASYGRTTGGAPANRKAQEALLVAQIALAMLLMASAGLVGRSFWQLKNLDPGFRTEELLTLSISFAGSAHEEAERQPQLFSSLLAEVGSLPGARQVGLINHLPIGGDSWGARFLVEGRPSEESGGLHPGSNYRVVTPGALEALGVSLREGRLFDSGDRIAAPPVILVNETLARRFFPKGDAVGSRLRFESAPVMEGAEQEEPWRTVVGITSDVRQWSLLDPMASEIYFPYGQNPVPWWTQTSLVIHTAGEPRGLADAARAAVWNVDSSLPVSQVRDAHQLLAPQVQEQRLQAWVMGLFASFSLLLAAVGLYGTLSYQVRMRRREIGIRMAIGARQNLVVRALALSGLRLAAVGVVLGLGAALVLRKTLASLLVDLSPTDPLTLAVVSALLFVVAGTACWLPARRASRVDPSTVLREQ